MRIVQDVPLKIDVPCKWASFQWNNMYLAISGLQYIKVVRIIKMCLHKAYNAVQVDKYVSDTFPINPLAYTAACEAAGLARSINTQPAVRRNSETNPTSQHNRGMY